MTDVHSRKIRSYNMAQIKSANTKPELIVRQYLFHRGLRFRINDKNLPGKPDLKFTKYKSVVFVNGCFWHMHNDCKYSKIPETNREWWTDKLNKNKERDIRISSELKKRGWQVLTIWECQLKSKNKLDRLSKLYQKIITH